MKHIYLTIITYVVIYLGWSSLDYDIAKNIIVLGFTISILYNAYCMKTSLLRNQRLYYADDSHIWLLAKNVGYLLILAYLGTPLLWALILTNCTLISITEI